MAAAVVVMPRGRRHAAPLPWAPDERVRVRSSGRPSPDVIHRRRRVVVASLVLGVLLGGRVVLGPVGGGPLSARRPAPSALISERVHVVQPGDTLWTIARSLQPEGDVRRLVDRLASQRQGAALQVGERIVLP